MIARKFGPEFVPDKPPVYTRKAKGAQEAHEAIRPTDAAPRSGQRQASS